VDVVLEELSSVGVSVSPKEDTTTVLLAVTVLALVA